MSEAMRVNRRRDSDLKDPWADSPLDRLLSMDAADEQPGRVSHNRSHPEDLIGAAATAVTIHNYIHM